MKWYTSHSSSYNLTRTNSLRSPFFIFNLHASIFLFPPSTSYFPPTLIIEFFKNSTNLPSPIKEISTSINSSPYSSLKTIYTFSSSKQSNSQNLVKHPQQNNTTSTSSPSIISISSSDSSALSSSSIISPSLSILVTLIYKYLHQIHDLLDHSINYLSHDDCQVDLEKALPYSQNSSTTPTKTSSKNQ